MGDEPGLAAHKQRLARGVLGDGDGAVFLWLSGKRRLGSELGLGRHGRCRRARGLELRPGKGEGPLLLACENALRGAMQQIRGKYGANALCRGISLMEGATGLERNRQIGGHRA